MESKAKSGFDKLDSAIKSSLQTLEQLENRQKALTQQIEQVKQKIQSQAQALEESKNKYNENTSALEKSNQKLEESKQAFESQKKVLADSAKNTEELKIKYETLKETQKKNADETIKAKEAYDASKQALNENRQSLGQLSAEYKGANSEYKNNVKAVKESEAEIKKLTKEQAAQQKTLNALEAELANTNNAVKTQEAQLKIATSSWVKFKTEMSDVSKNMKIVSDSLHTIGKGITDIGTKMTIGITVPLTLMGKKIISAGMDFEASLSGIKAVTGATADEMALLQKAALKAGEDTKYSASESAGAIEELAKAGLTTAQILEGGLSGALTLAAAGEIEVADAAEIASTVLNAFRKDALNVGDAANILAGAANASATDVGELKHGLSAVSPVAAGMGMGFRDTATALAVFAQNGLKGSDAGTSLKTMLMNLQPQTDNQIAKFAELGLLTEEGTSRFYDMNGSMRPLNEIAGLLNVSMADLTEAERAMALEVMFGSDAIRAGNILFAEGAEGVTNMADAMAKIKAADVAAERMNNLKGRVEELGGKFETLQIKLFDTADGALSAIVEKVTDVVKWMLELDDKTLQTILVIAGIAAAIGPVLVITGHLITSIGSIAGAVSTFTKAVSLMGMTAGMAATPTVLLASALTLLTSSIFLVAAGVTAFVAGLAILIVKFREQDEAFLNAVKSTDALIEKYNQTTNRVNELNAAYDRQKESLSLQSIITQDLAAEVIELSKAENKSVEDKALLQTKIDQLNKMIPDLTLAYDEEREALIDTATATEISADAIYRQVTAQEAQLALTSQLQEQHRLKEDTLKLEGELKEIQEERAAVEEKLTNSSDMHKAAQKRLSDQIEELTIEEESHAKALANIQGKQSVLSISISENSVIVEENKKRIKENTDAIDKSTQSSIENELALQKDAEAQKKSAEAIEAHEKAARKLADEYEDLTGKVQNAFKAIDSTTELTFENMQENQAENKRVMKQWGEDLAHIAKVAGEDFATYLREMGVESAAEISVLAQASDEELKKFAQGWRDTPSEALESFSQGVSIEELQAAGVDLTEIIAGGVSGSENIKIAAVSQITGAKSAMDDQVKAENFPSVGSNMGGGVVVGLNDSSSTVRAAARRIIEKALSEMRAVAMIKSPSKATKEIAEYMGDGLIIGTENKTEEVAKSGAQLAARYIASISDEFDVGLAEAVGLALGSWTELNQGMKEIVEKSGMDVVQAEISSLDALIKETETKAAERNKAAELANKQRAVSEAKSGQELLKAQEELNKYLEANNLESLKNRKAALETQLQETADAYQELHDVIIVALKKKYEKEKELSIDTLEDEVERRREASEEIIEQFEAEYEAKILEAERAKIDLENIVRQEYKDRKEASEEMIKQYEAEYKAKMKTFDTEEYEEVTALEVLIDAIDNQTEAEERAMKQQEDQRKLFDLEQKLQQAETAEERIEAQEKLNTELAKQARAALLQQRKDEKEALKEQIAEVKANYKEQRDAAKDFLEERQEEYKKDEEENAALLERKLDAIKIQYEIDRNAAKEDIEARRNEHKQREKDIDDFLKTESDKITAHYETLTDKERMEADARAIIIEGNHDKIVSLLEEHVSDWQTAGRSAAQSYLDEIQGLTPSIESAVQHLMGLVDGAHKAKSELSNINFNMPEQQNSSVQQNAPIYQPQVPQVYTVQRNDTLWSIGLKYGISAEKIRKENGLKGENDTKLPIGTVLRIPVLHEGGVSTKEQLALIDNKEAILPLAQLSKMLEQVAIASSNNVVAGLMSSVMNYSNTTNHKDSDVNVDLNLNYYGSGSRQDAETFGGFSVDSIYKELRGLGYAIPLGR